MEKASAEVLQVVQKAAVNGKLSCLRAHELSRETGIPLRQIGDAANQLEIKIVSCQLGCF